jgi:hypothetical protein
MQITEIEASAPHITSSAGFAGWILPAGFYRLDFAGWILPLNVCIFYFKTKFQEERRQREKLYRKSKINTLIICS